MKFNNRNDWTYQCLLNKSNIQFKVCYFHLNIQVSLKYNLFYYRCCNGNNLEPSFDLSFDRLATY